MAKNARSGTVIFTEDKDRLTKFYHGVTGLPIRTDDESVTVLASDHVEIVIHALSGEPVGDHAAPRRDVYLKPFFPVASLAEAREKAATLGGSLSPASEEWAARGFKACEAIDPDGNVIQLREDEPQRS